MVNYKMYNNSLNNATITPAEINFIINFIEIVSQQIFTGINIHRLVYSQDLVRRN